MARNRWIQVHYRSGRRGVAIPLRVEHLASPDDLASALAQSIAAEQGGNDPFPALTVADIRQRIIEQYRTDGSSGGAYWADDYNDAQAERIGAWARAQVERAYGTPPPIAAPDIGAG